MRGWERWERGGGGEQEAERVGKILFGMNDRLRADRGWVSGERVSGSGGREEEQRERAEKFEDQENRKNREIRNIDRQTRETTEAQASKDDFN